MAPGTESVPTLPELPVSLFATVRFHRKNASLIQEEFAEAVDLNPKYIGAVERGEKIISIEALLRIAKAVKKPVREFFRGV